MKKILLMLLGVLLIPSLLFADEITIQEGSTYGTTDNELKEYESHINYSTVVETPISTYAVGDRRNYIIKFDLSGIPSDKIITNVKLYMFRNGGSTSTDTIRCNRLLRNWNETQSTWDIFSTGNSWSTGGAAYDDLDRSSTESASLSVTNVNEWKIFESTQLITDVQNFIDTTYSNYGWVLWIDGPTNNHYHQFAADNFATAEYRPKLVVTYSDAPVSLGKIVVKNGVIFK